MKTLRLLLPAVALLLCGCLGIGSEKRIDAAGKLSEKCPIRVDERLTLVEAHFAPTYQMVFNFEGDTVMAEEPSKDEIRQFTQFIKEVPAIDSLLTFVLQNPSGVCYNINDGMDEVADSTLAASSDTAKPRRTASYMTISKEELPEMYY